VADGAGKTPDINKLTVAAAKSEVRRRAGEVGSSSEGNRIEQQQFTKP